MALGINVNITALRERKQVKSFRVARRRESSVGLTRDAAAVYGIFTQTGPALGIVVSSDEPEEGVCYGVVMPVRARSREPAGGGPGASGKRAQRKAHNSVACGACGLVAEEAGGGAGSWSHRVARREPADQHEMADPAMRAGGRER